MTAETTLLKSLTKTTVDSAEGYRLAAEHARSPKLQEVLGDAAGKRRRLVDTLNAELVRLGADKEDSSSTAGSMHRTWVNITTAFKDNDEAAAERVEEGEDYIKEKFEEALDHKDWEPETRAVLEKAYAEVKAGERLTDQLEKAYD